MKKEALKRIFEFLEEKGEHIIPLPVKIKLATPIAKEDLNVKGDLKIVNGFNLTSLPEGLKVGGILYLSNSNITSLPKGLEVGGDLFLSSSKITSLPEGLKVGKDLHLDYTNITSLPEGLEVDFNIHFNQSTIKSLPKGLKVGGFIFIRNTPLIKYSDNQLREMIKPGSIKGKIIR